MRRRPILRMAVSFLLLLAVASSCSSTDPTSSDEYTALAQQLAQVQSQLGEVTAERDAIVAGARDTAGGSTAMDTMVAPDELVAFVDAWEAALNRGDGSAIDLYVPGGYHLYGDKRYERDELVAHLSADGIQQQWLTEPLLIAEDEDGRYVVVRGLRNSSAIWSNRSALLFEIVTTPEGELKLAQTAWFYDSEWGG